MPLLLRPSSSADAGTSLPATPLPSVRVLWRPEQFNRVTNPGFETNTTGWATTAGINEAATSITRITTDAHGGSACASVACTSTDGSGVNFDMGTNRFYAEATYGTVYIATGWVKRVSGIRRLRVTLGSLGTSADRATLTITDLLDSWQPFSVRWMPTAARTDVELAITNGHAENLTFLLDDVAVYQVDAFSQVENGFFPVDTTGWDIAGGTIAAAATSLTQTADGFAATSQTCAELVTTATAGSGAGYSLGNRTFTNGRTYRARVAIKRVSGGGVGVVTLGSIGTAGDRATSGLIALTSSWAWYTVDWTPSADRTDVAVVISNNTSSGAVVTMRIDHVEVYEASDDLGSDVASLRWDRRLDAIGSITCSVRDADGEYHPRNTAAALYGSVSPGKRIWGRATYSSALYPLFYGTLTTIEPPALGGIHTDLIAEDVMGDLSRATCSSDFAAGDTYAAVRSWAIASYLSGVSNIADATVAASTAHESLAAGIESNTFYRATDGDVGILDLLTDLNQATQTAHFVKPHVAANIGWRYTTVDRSTLTDTSSDFTVDEDFEDFTGTRVTHEALENHQDVPWQAYELIPTQTADDNGNGLVMVARVATDPDADPDDPYLHYTDDEFGTDDDHPEPRWRYPHGMTAWRWRKLRRRGVKVKRRTKVYPDAFVPFTMASGDRRTFVLDFAVPVSGFVLSTGGGLPFYDLTVLESRPNRWVVELTAFGAQTFSKFEVYGTPYLPLDELDEPCDNLESQALYGQHAGPSLFTAYIPSLGDAQGVGDFRNWRYGSPRMRPTLMDHNTFPRGLTADLTDHLTVSADRWRVDALLFTVTGCSWDVTRGGVDWRTSFDLEEVPTHTDWFVLDSSALDGADILAY